MLDADPELWRKPLGGYGSPAPLDGTADGGRSPGEVICAFRVTGPRVPVQALRVRVGQQAARADECATGRAQQSAPGVGRHRWPVRTVKGAMPRGCSRQPC